MKQILCSECGQPVSSAINTNEIIFRGYTLCPDCLEFIPDDIANAFFTAADIAGKQRKALFLNGSETI